MGPATPAPMGEHSGKQVPAEYKAGEVPSNTTVVKLNI